MATKKAGLVLFDVNTRKVALIFRDHIGDISFPKGHLEEGETLLECAIRETAEETKRDARVLEWCPSYIEKYETPSGEQCECHWYLAEDIGASQNDSPDTHEVLWVDIEKVEESLSYDSLKILWKIFKKYILEHLDKSET